MRVAENPFAAYPHQSKPDTLFDYANAPDANKSGTRPQAATVPNYENFNAQISLTYFLIIFRKTCKINIMYACDVMKVQQADIGINHVARSGPLSATPSFRKWTKKRNAIRTSH